MLHRLAISGAVCVFLFLSACQDYDFKVNDKVVYSPTLFSDFAVPDAGLRSCLEQAIKDAAITEPSQLTVLDCSFAGIENLQGLSAFTAMRALRLPANEIRNLLELQRLSALETLYLNDNKVIDPVPLYQLPALRQLDLSGNPDLQCPKPGQLMQVTTLKLPQHCR